MAGALSIGCNRLAVGQGLLVLRRIGSNAVRGSSRRHQALRFTIAGLVLAACSWGAGCERRPWTIAEAFDIPSPSPYLLARHTRPACDFGAPEEIPESGEQREEKQEKKQDNWSPYTENPDQGPARGNYIDKSAKETVASDDAIEALDALSQERDCYRQAEQHARGKLQKLQSSVRDTMDTIHQPKLWPQGKELQASIKSSIESIKQSKVWPRPRNQDPM